MKIFSILLLCINISVNAATYYVSNTGNDNANGTTTGTPWQTIAKVNNTTFTAGDVVLFKRGHVFTGTLVIDNNGNSENYITFGAYDTGAKPIISAFNTVSSWTNLGSNIWQSTNAISALSYVKSVSINGVNSPMGKIPKVAPASNLTNLVLNKTVTTSTVEEAGFEGNFAVDGSLATRWSSAWGNNEWIYIDMGSTQSIAYVQLRWESAYASGYYIQTSPDHSTWTTIYTKVGGTGGIEEITGLTGSGRYLRIYCVTKATSYGISLYEITAYSQEPTTVPNTTVDGFYRISSHANQTSFVSSDLTGTPNWTGSEVVIRAGQYTMIKSTVTSQSGSTLNFNDAGLFYNNGFFFQNDIRCCTQQNDWFYDGTSKKINIYSTSQPVNVKVSNLDYNIQIEASYINIQNLELHGANIDAVLAQYSDSFINITNTTVRNVGVCGFNMNSPHTTLNQDSCIDSNSGGVDIAYGNYATVTNCYLYNSGIYPGMRAGNDHGDFGALQVGVLSNALVQYNRIINSAYNGINFYGQNIEIRNNFIDNFCILFDDGAGIYTYSGVGRAPMNGSKIISNICINGVGGNSPGIDSHLGSAGIYLDEETANTEVAYNTCANTYAYGIQCNINDGNNNFHHNTVFNGSSYQFHTSMFDGQTTPETTRFKYNILVAKESSQACLAFGFGGSSGTSIFISTHDLDSNIYSKPIATSAIVNGNNTLYTLAQWKTTSGKESHTTGSPQSITDVNKLHFIYNNTNTVKKYSLSATATGMNGTTYNGSVSLQPWTSLVLISNVAPRDQPVVRYKAYGKRLKYKGKFVI